MCFVKALLRIVHKTYHNLSSKMFLIVDSFFPNVQKDWFDYHFLRQHSDGTWYHKNGFSGDISNYDFQGQIITNLKECYIPCRTYKKCLSRKLK